MRLGLGRVFDHLPPRLSQRRAFGVFAARFPGLESSDDWMMLMDSDAPTENVTERAAGHRSPSGSPVALRTGVSLR